MQLSINFNETWKDIPNYEGWYQASSIGRIKGIKRIIPNNCTKNGDPVYKTERLLKQNLNRQGYPVCTLTKNLKRKTFTVHRLVALTFVPNPDNKPQVNHKDGIKLNNTVENLEWNTCQENIIHAWNNGLKHMSEYQLDKLVERSCKKIIDTETGVIYNSMKQAAKEYNISYSTLKNNFRTNTINKTNLILYNP